MPGQIKTMIDKIIEKKSGGDELLIRSTKVKMILKGIYPDRYSGTSEDDPAVIQKLKSLASELNITI